MRRIFCLLAAIAVAAFAAPAAAETPDSGSTPASGPKNTITANPLGLAFGMFNFEYERATSERISWYVGPTYWGFSTDSGGSEFDVAAYGLSGGMRYFLSGTAPEGFFVSPGVSFAYTTVDATESASSMGYSVSAMGGYTWIFGGVFDLSLGLGVQYQSIEAEANGTTVGLSGVLPAGRLSLGAAF